MKLVTLFFALLTLIGCQPGNFEESPEAEGGSEPQNCPNMGGTPENPPAPSCEDSLYCEVSHYCEPRSGTCQLRLPDGAPCTTDDECGRWNTFCGLAHDGTDQTVCRSLGYPGEFCLDDEECYSEQCKVESYSCG